MTKSIFVDFHNSDKKGRVRLITSRTKEELERNKIALKEGIELWLDDDEGNCVPGVVEFSKEENSWVAVLKS